MISSTAKASFAAVSRAWRFHALPHARVCNPPQCQLSNVGTPIHRRFSQSVKSAYPRKDSQDKDSINTEATEYSKSATDDEGARQEDAAFDPNITDPQQEKDKAGEGTEGTVSKQVQANPLLELRPRACTHHLFRRQKNLRLIIMTMPYSCRCGC